MSAFSANAEQVRSKATNARISVTSVFEFEIAELINLSQHKKDLNDITAA